MEAQNSESDRREREAHGALPSTARLHEIFCTYFMRCMSVVCSTGGGGQGAEITVLQLKLGRSTEICDLSATVALCCPAFANGLHHWLRRQTLTRSRLHKRSNSAAPAFGLPQLDCIYIRISRYLLPLHHKLSDKRPVILSPKLPAPGFVAPYSIPPPALLAGSRYNRNLVCRILNTTVVCTVDARLQL